MDNINEIVKLIESKKNQNWGEPQFPISNFYKILGFYDKHTFYRSLVNANYDIKIEREKIDKRVGREYYIGINTLVKLIYNRIDKCIALENAYIDYFYAKFKSIIFVFEDSLKPKYRLNVGVHENIKGTFYNYSLNTNSFSSMVGVCPFDMYKLAIKNLNISYGKTTIIFSSLTPSICFDSVNKSTRDKFLTFIDLVLEQTELSNYQKVRIKAYRIAVKEMLEYQDNIDIEVAKKKRKVQTDAESKLKSIYREASKYYHPDVNKTPVAESIMKQINNFYEKKDYHSIKNIMDKALRTV